jgi:hypothetical protein
MRPSRIRGNLGGATITGAATDGAKRPDQDRVFSLFAIA